MVQKTKGYLLEMKRNRNAHSEKLSFHFDPVQCTIFTVHLFDKSLRYTSFYFFSRHYNVKYGHKILKGTLQSSLKIHTNMAHDKT